jgi:N-hydroxyarylamine O-acetyltransferase
LFEELYLPLPDSGAYLRRIGMPPAVDAVRTDAETLSALVLAHRRSVPFENLDVYDAGLGIDLGIPALYDKIVARRRGGYCFELNAAFEALLTSLGYDCHAVAVRVLTDECPKLPPLSHRAVLVTVDGVRYFCDVGFGGPSPQGALLLDEPGVQFSGGNLFSFERDASGTVMFRHYNGRKTPLLGFLETPCDPIDFLALNEYRSKNKASDFVNERFCHIVTETGSVSLVNESLVVKGAGMSFERALETEGELRDALQVFFGISVGYTLRI